MMSTGPEMTPQERDAVEETVQRHIAEREHGHDVPGYRITAADPEQRRAQWDELFALLDGSARAA